MKILNQLTDSIRYALLGSKDRPYPDTYREELEYQNRRLTPVFMILGLFIWLPYIPVDMKNFPHQPLMPLTRAGLSVLGVFAVINYIIKPWRYWGTMIVSVGMSYLVLGSGFCALLSGADSSYIGGFIFCLSLFALVVPLPYWLMLTTLTIAYVGFFSGAYALGIEFKTNSQRYSLNDLASSIIVFNIIGYVQHRIRRSHYLRAKAVEREKAESNRLLLNILPAKIAEELKTQGAVEPLFYDSATILFTDFVGFTEAAKVMLPDELIAQLNNIFFQFDEISRKYRIEKIKTIGDAYMAAGGLPEMNNTHPIDVCLAALEIKRLTNQILDLTEHDSGSKFWRLRIGIHSGSVMAGIVGQLKFAYDIFGDAVNVASRMESTGLPNQINISADTYEAVKYFFNCTFRGSLEVKGRGPMDMYLLHNLKSKYLNEHDAPNARFLDIYAKLKGGARIEPKLIAPSTSNGVGSTTLPTASVRGS
ncbi:MAG: adenylate/guanylate cyclase domain-containing protein [Spirochaetes bacterium]|nr:adenylate/guanylate cyclase domain-containing protein [Spirochaetota bacterium]